MGNRQRIIAVFAVAIAAIIGLSYLERYVQSVTAVEVKLVSTPVEGEVLAVEKLSEPSRKEAVVKLTSGETVRAFVPPACIVFPGQMASLSRMHAEGMSGSFYVLKESWGRNDS
ncbi:MAG: hypothetical protein IPH30_03520 [Betaproteobacteria bacterium]|nr:hypothetical protein [Betaproteobacteria bacterium]